MAPKVEHAFCCFPWPNMAERRMQSRGLSMDEANCSAILGACIRGSCWRTACVLGETLCRSSAVQKFTALPNCRSSKEGSCLRWSGFSDSLPSHVLFAAVSACEVAEVPGISDHFGCESIAKITRDGDLR